MANILSLVFIFFLNLSFASSAHSQNLYLFNETQARDTFALFTLNITTHSGRPVKTKVAEADYVGVSQSAPCSDLRLFTSGYGETEIKPGNYPFGADHFKEYPGPGYTCFKMAFNIKGKEYSTGNIQLTWNDVNHNYIDANPRIIPIEIDW